MTDNDIARHAVKHTGWKYWGLYLIAIVLGVLNGIYQTGFGMSAAEFFSEVFIRLFKFVSIPIIGVTICLTIINLGSSAASRSLWKRTLGYTLTTTVLAALTAAALYLVVAPGNYAAPGGAGDGSVYTGLADKKEYIDYFISVVPDNILTPFFSGNVLSVLLIAILSGIAVRSIRNEDNKKAVVNFLAGFQDVLFTFIGWIIRILPLGIFGFITVCVRDFSSELQLGGIASYFSVVIGANLIQAFAVLPLFLLFKKINPLRTFAGMFKALSVAFFSKSSAATLPVTMTCAEQNNGVAPKVARFVLPICTTINMNGCAAFILTTVVYLMQNDGAAVTPALLLVWVVIATIAAIGNAGVPMGCFFLSASLLASMDVPIELMGIILPVYTVIDMLETSLNVWSDSCVAAAVNKDLAGKLDDRT